MAGQADPGQAPVPERILVLVLDSQGYVRFSSASDAGRYKGHRLVGSRLWDLVADSADERARRALTEAVHQCAVTEFEAPLAASRGAGRASAWQVTPVTDAEGVCREVVVVGLDPTAFAPLGHELVEAFFAHTLAATALADRDLKLIRVNQAYARIFGRDLEDFPGQELAKLYPGDAQAALRSVTVEKRPHIDTERPFVVPDRPEGGVRYWDCEVVPVLDDANEVVVVLVSVWNVTERKRAAEALERSRARLRALAAELSIAESGERRRIARELHDHVGHALSYALLKLEELRDHLPPDAAPMADELQTFLDRAADAVHSMTFELSPPILHDLGLAPALEWLAEGLEHEHDLRVDLDVPDDPPRLPESTAAMLFRTARELLANVIKHARTTRATISLRYAPDAIRLEVQDDGVGFDPSRLDDEERTASSFGLLSIDQHVSYFGGLVSIVSAHGAGTRVVCVVPLGTPQIEADADESSPGR